MDILFITLSAIPESVANARRGVKCIPKRYFSGLDPDIVELVLSELVTNAIDIADDVDAVVGMRISRGEGGLCIEVSDPSERVPDFSCISNSKDTEESGRGLFIVKACGGILSAHASETGKVIRCILVPERVAGDASVKSGVSLKKSDAKAAATAA